MMNITIIKKVNIINIVHDINNNKGNNRNDNHNYEQINHQHSGKAISPPFY